MQNSFASRFALIAILLVAFAVVPLFAHAQSSSTSSAQLRAAIQTAVLKDPSSGNVPPAQLDSLIDALTAQAQAQGITADQINYRPGQQLLGAPKTAAVCTTLLCSLSSAFGFYGAGGPVLFIILILAGILILIIGTMLLRHHHTTPSPQQ